MSSKTFVISSFKSEIKTYQPLPVGQLLFILVTVRFAISFMTLFHDIHIFPFESFSLPELRATEGHASGSKFLCQRKTSFRTERNLVSWFCFFRTWCQTWSVYRTTNYSYAGTGHGLKIVPKIQTVFKLRLQKHWI